jgi:hypothetical protein
MKRNSIVSTLIISASLAGCAGHYRESESMEAKIQRYESRSTLTNVVPLLKPIAWTQSPSRAVASIPDMAVRESEFNSLSNRRVYFLALLSQYQQLKGRMNMSAPDIKVCPRFHTWVVDYNERAQKMERNLSVKVLAPLTEEAGRLHPELLLPLSADKAYPTVFDIALKDKSTPTDELIKKALTIHLSKMYTELGELCEYGNSNNYYIYENLISHVIVSPRFGEKSKDIEALFKISIISNMALIKSLALNTVETTSISRKTASISEKISPLEMEALSRLSIGWIKNYFTDFERERSGRSKIK